MTITKGFLNVKYELQPKYLIGSLFLWLMSSYTLYAFFQLYRETFRLLTGWYGDRAFLILTPRENFIYNLFYAAIASALSYGIALRFLLNNSPQIHEWKTSSLIRRTLNSEGFFNALFLLWFGRLGSIFGFFYSITSMKYDLDLIKEFPLMLLLLPLTIFYSSWPSLSRLIRTKKLTWILSTTCMFLMMSFGFAFKNFAEYEKINNNFLKHSIEHLFKLQVPESQHYHQIVRKASAINVYIVRDTANKEVPVIFFENIENRVEPANIQSAIKSAQAKISEWEYYQIIINLHIDERIQMSHVKGIMEEFRKTNLRNFQYSTTKKFSHYPPDYPPFKYAGIQRVLFPYFPEFESFIDSLAQIKLKGQSINLSESRMYRNEAFSGLEQIEITVSPETTLLNGKQINSPDLSQKVNAFIKKYSPKYVIILNAHDEITYKQYIEVLDMLLTQVDQLRNELSLKLYNQPFDHWDAETERDTIKSQYPNNFLEWTPEEKRLNELLDITNNNH